MDRRTVQLQVGGEKLRVVSSATDEELEALAGVVTAKLEQVNSRFGSAQTSVWAMAALSLAHELCEERSRREQVESRARDILRRVIHRIDDALEATEAGKVPPPATPGT